MIAAAHSRRAGRSPRERGFTLIEMIVVLVLLAVASASMFPAITSMLRSSTRSAAMTGASGDGKIAERFMEHDVRGAAGNRSKGNRTDLITADASVVRALASTTPSSHDIVEATATTLTLYTEAIRSSPGVERVTWALRQDSPTCGETGSSNRNWCIVRTVVGTGATVSEVITRGRNTFPATVPNSPCGAAGVRLFCYRVAENASYDWTSGWSPNGCTTRWANLNSTFGAGGWIAVVRNGFDGPMQMHQLDLITQVAVTLPSGGGFASTSERTFAITELAIRSRQGEAYQQAIMCGAR